MLRKYDSSGNLLWTRNGVAWFGFSGEYFGIIALGNAIHAVGTQNNGVAGTHDFLIQKWDESGELPWISTFDNAGGIDEWYDVTGIGDPLLAVGSSDGASFGGNDAMLMEISPSDGSLRAQIAFGGRPADTARGVAVIGTQVYVAGETRSTVGGGNLAGQNDVFLVQYQANFETTTVSIMGNDLVMQDTQRGITADQITLSTNGTNMIVHDSNLLLLTAIPGATGNGLLRIDDTAVFPLTTLPAANYTLVKPTGLSPAPRISLSPGGSTFCTLTPDARTIHGQGDFPLEVRIVRNDFDENVIQATDATGIPDPTDLVNMPPRDVEPFTFDVRGVVTDEWIIDDGDAQFKNLGVWTVPSTVSGYLQDDRITPGDGSGET